MQDQSSRSAIYGVYTSLLLVLMTVITFGIAILTPPKSGPNCTGKCYDYPYLDIESRFPRDYWWMIPAIVLTLVFVAWIVCIHNDAAPSKRLFSQISLAFAIIAATILIVDYFVQLSVIQSSLESGETEGITILTQFNPHGLFIALEEIGYLVMALSFLLVAPVFTGIIRWVFALSFGLAIIALIAVTLSYGIDRQDRFEIMIISIDWLVLLINGILVSRVFRRTISALL